jgi:hypothetical protein
LIGFSSEITPTDSQSQNSWFQALAFNGLSTLSTILLLASRLELESARNGRRYRDEWDQAALIVACS